MRAPETSRREPGLTAPELGASLHDVLTRLKAEPARFPALQVLYSPDSPVTEPVCLSLPSNGLRLRFDGPEQRLRLIEVLDFGKTTIMYNDKDMVKDGPWFKNLYHRVFGPTYAGEYIPGDDGKGTYVLSYPGMAFNFDLDSGAYSPDKDVVGLLSNSKASVMAIFHAQDPKKGSWSDVRPTLWTETIPSIKATSISSRSKDVFPDEVSLAKLHGGGKIELVRRWENKSTFILLGETTPQDLVRELGPPSAIYRKNDSKMVIHKMRATSHSRSRPSAGSLGRPDDLTDTDHSSMNTGSDESDDEAIDEAVNNPAGECFYNYFYFGFDVLLSTPVDPSPQPPGQPATDASEIKSHTPDRLVATKLVLHGNIPGSYEFNRHRRLRWAIPYLPQPTTSESPFPDVEDAMTEKWGSKVQKDSKRGMVLNRGWGDSPGSSCELLGGWEEGTAGRRAEVGGDSTTTLYGFPGMVFEVLRNGFVNTVTVF